MGVPYAEVIGDPVAHSKSPAIHKFWLEKLGLEGDYHAVRVRADELEDYLESRRADPDWLGCNVTMPLKEAALDRVEVNSSTGRIGALNTIVNMKPGLLGINTDWQALNIVLDTDRLRPQRIAIIGTGGAARAALEEMRSCKAPHVTLISRDHAKARALLERFGLAGDVLAHGQAPEADLLINASPLGMRGFPSLEINLSALAPGATIVELVYQPLETPLVKAARLLGCRTIDGMRMLIEQAAMAFTYFFKDSPPPIGNDGLRERLTS